VLRDLQEYAIEITHAKRALRSVWVISTSHTHFTALDQPPSPPKPLMLLDPLPLIQVRILLAEGSPRRL
jgi:hypothetical protein